MGRVPRRAHVPLLPLLLLAVGSSPASASWLKLPFLPAAMGCGDHGSSSWTPPKETGGVGGGGGGAFIDVSRHTSPRPTEAPRLELERRIAGFTMKPDTCGYIASYWDNSFTCVEVGATCTNDGTYIGCCQVGGAVCTTKLQRTCIDYQASAAGKCAVQGSNTLCCSESASPFCYTYTMAATSLSKALTLFDCDVEAGLGPLLDYPPSFTRSGTTSDASLLPSAPTTTLTGSADPAIKTLPPAASSSSPGGTSTQGTPAGAIIGGVVGGVALVGLVGLAAFFVLLRRSRGPYRRAYAGTSLGGGVFATGAGGRRGGGGGGGDGVSESTKSVDGGGAGGGGGGGGGGGASGVSGGGGQSLLMLSPSGKEWAGGSSSSLSPGSSGSALVGGGGGGGGGGYYAPVPTAPPATTSSYDPTAPASAGVGLQVGGGPPGSLGAPYDPATAYAMQTPQAAMGGMYSAAAVSAVPSSAGGSTGYGIVSPYDPPVGGGLLMQQPGMMAGLGVYGGGVQYQQQHLQQQQQPYPYGPVGPYHHHGLPHQVPPHQVPPPIIGQHAPQQQGVVTSELDSTQIRGELM